MIKKYGSRTNITTDINKEPVLKDLFSPKASSGGNVPIRGDILLDIGGVKKVLDVVISHPRAHSEPRVADTTPGIAAYIAALKKENLYYNNFVIPAGHMVPLSAETGGRFDGAFSNFLKEVVTSGQPGFRRVTRTSLDQREACSLYITLAHCACDNFLCYRTLRCKCPHLWVEDYARYPVREAVGLLS